MKKIISLILILLLVLGGVYWYKFIYLANIIPVLDIEEEKVNIDEYYIYGTYLSMSGNVENIDAMYKDVDLILYDGQFHSYRINKKKNTNRLSFTLDEEINRGINLEELEDGSYPMFLRFSYEIIDDNEDNNKKDKEEKEYEYKYYVLNNDTKYDNTTYYTMDNDRKIIINSDNDYKTMMFNISDNTDKDKYDIVIDPGHGGVDSGAITNNGEYNESELCMNFSLLLKSKLEDSGYSVKLTRDKDSLGEKDYFDEYNEHGRAVIPYEVGAKYVFSIHMNSSDSTNVRGFELYTASDIDYTLAYSIADSILDSNIIVSSSNKIHKESDGIYTHNYSDYEINAAMERYDNKGYKRYNVTNNSNYLYMIRETGGFMTGAYVDDSNPKSVGVNPYYDSNIGSEAYLLELGYLTNSTDLDILVNKQDEYASIISEGIIRYLKGEYIDE